MRVLSAEESCSTSGTPIPLTLFHFRTMNPFAQEYSAASFTSPPLLRNTRDLRVLRVSPHQDEVPLSRDRHNKESMRALADRQSLLLFESSAESLPGHSERSTSFRSLSRGTVDSARSVDGQRDVSIEGEARQTQEREVVGKENLPPMSSNSSHHPARHQDSRVEQGPRMTGTDFVGAWTGSGRPMLPEIKAHSSVSRNVSFHSDVRENGSYEHETDMRWNADIDQRYSLYETHAGSSRMHEDFPDVEASDAALENDGPTHDPRSAQIIISPPPPPPPPPPFSSSFSSSSSSDFFFFVFSSSSTSSSFFSSRSFLLLSFTYKHRFILLFQRFSYPRSIINIVEDMETLADPDHLQPAARSLSNSNPRPPGRPAFDKREGLGSSVAPKYRDRSPRDNSVGDLASDLEEARLLENIFFVSGRR